jgi:hypothetical protein
MGTGQETVTQEPQKKRVLVFFGQKKSAEWSKLHRGQKGSANRAREKRDRDWRADIPVRSKLRMFRPCWRI